MTALPDRRFAVIEQRPGHRPRVVSDLVLQATAVLLSQQYADDHRGRQYTVAELVVQP